MNAVPPTCRGPIQVGAEPQEVMSSQNPVALTQTMYFYKEIHLTYINIYPEPNKQKKLSFRTYKLKIMDTRLPTGRIKHYKIPVMTKFLSPVFIFVSSL